MSISDYLDGMFNDPFYGMVQRKTAPSGDENDAATVDEYSLSNRSIVTGRSGTRSKRRLITDISGGRGAGAGAGIRYNNPNESSSDDEHVTRRNRQRARTSSTNSSTSTLVQNEVKPLVKKEDIPNDGIYAEELFRRRRRPSSNNSSGRSASRARAVPGQLRQPSSSDARNRPVLTHAMFAGIALPVDPQPPRPNEVPREEIAEEEVKDETEEKDRPENYYQIEFDTFYNKLITIMNRMNVVCPIEGLQAFYDYLKENVADKPQGIAKMYRLDQTTLQTKICSLVSRALVQNRFDLIIPGSAQNNGNDNQQITKDVIRISLAAQGDTWIVHLIDNLVAHHKRLLDYQLHSREHQLVRSTLAIVPSDFPVPLNLYGQQKPKQNMQNNFKNVVFKILVPGINTTAIHIQKFLNKNCMVGEDSKCGNGTGVVKRCMSSVYTTPVNQSRVKESFAFAQTLRSMQQVSRFENLLTWYRPSETREKAYIEELSYNTFPDNNHAVFHVVVLTSVNCSILHEHLNNVLNNESNVFPYNKYNTYLLVVFEPIYSGEQALIKTMYDKVQYIINNIKGPYRGVYFMVGKPTKIDNVDILTNYYDYNMSEHTIKDEAAKTNKYRIKGITYSFDQLHSVYFKDEYNFDLLSATPQDNGEILQWAKYHGLSLWGIVSPSLPLVAFSAEIFSATFPDEYNNMKAAADFVSLIGRVYFMFRNADAIQRSSINLMTLIINSAKNVTTVIAKKLAIMKETNNHEAVDERLPLNEYAATSSSSSRPAVPSQTNTALSNRQNGNSLNAAGEFNMHQNAYVPLFIN